MRRAFSKLKMQISSQYPTLREACGGKDLADDYLVFERELERIIAESKGEEAAAALSIAAPRDLFLHR